MKILPQAIEVEESVLGQMLIDKNAIDKALDMLTAKMFYQEKNKIIFEAIEKLVYQNSGVDIITLFEEIKKNSTSEIVGGAVGISQLTRKILSAQNIEYHCRIIQDKYIKREMIAISLNISEKAYEESEELTFDSIEQQFETLYEIVRQKKEPITSQKAIINTINKIRDNKSRTKGVTSGLKELDQITLGWQKSDLIIIGARPSMGKTALALQFAINAAKTTKVLFFSLEMSNDQVAIRLLTNQTGINYRDIKNSNCQYEKLGEISALKFTENLIIDDNPTHTIFSLKTTIKKYIKQGCELVVIDYLQLIKGRDALITNANRYIGEISRNLKQIAKEFDIPIILLSQLSRDVEKRANPFPKLSDLRDSGEIEQDADIIIFPTRFEKLGKEFQTDDLGNDLTNKAVLDIAKHRNGETGRVFIKISEDKSKWYDDNYDTDYMNF
jgi:replicative DNA helicase